MATTKKSTRKVETPIDERETFVSLQKNFADSAQSVQDKLRLLYTLQGADNEIEKLVLRRGELPAEVEVLETEINGLQEKVARFKEAIDENNAKIEVSKKTMVEHDAEIDKYQRQLEGTSNSREYDSISKELENTNLLRQIDQKNLDEAKARIEDLKEKISAVSDQIEIRLQDLAAKKDELDVIVNSTAKEEQKLVDTRNSIAANLDARTLSAYDRIRNSVHNHLAVVPVYMGNACGGCFNTITPQRLVDINSGNKLIICEHCGRIIVNPGKKD